FAKAYYLMTAQFTTEERQQRSWYGGAFREGLRPIKPYRWQMDARSLIEIPVTTMPFLKFPIHLSYILWLSIFSQTLAKQYFELALILCRLTGTHLSLLLHPTNFLGCDDTKDLSFLPEMSLPSKKKLELLSHVLMRLTTEFTVLTLQKHAQAASCDCKLREHEPSFLK
ncbi:polysaccharide deacetylase, partial [bacterium]|nr:polysaccharide deacetylase [bacterium]